MHNELQLKRIIVDYLIKNHVFHTVSRKLSDSYNTEDLLNFFEQKHLFEKGIFVNSRHAAVSYESFATSEVFTVSYGNTILEARLIAAVKYIQSTGNDIVHGEPLKKAKLYPYANTK